MVVAANTTHSKFGWSHDFSDMQDTISEDKLKLGQTDHKARIEFITPTVVTKICLEPVQYWGDKEVNNSRIQKFCKEKIPTATGLK